MSRTKLQQIDAAVSGFITKATKKNEPLEAFRETDHFTTFQDKLTAAIRKQAKWLADNLKNVDYLQDEDLSDSQFSAKFGTWLENEMPLLDQYIDQDKLATWLTEAFVWSVQSAYSRLGVIVKASTGFVNFELTNPHYIAALNDQANYLLHKSKIDDTTRSRMINLIRDSRLDLTDLNDLSNMITAEFEGISDTRAYLIANTETNQAMSTAQHAFLTENGFKTKQWVGAGENTCPECQGNEDDGPLPLDDDFSSGDAHPPAHPGCECYEDGADEIDLNSVELWSGA